MYPADHDHQLSCTALSETFVGLDDATSPQFSGTQDVRRPDTSVCSSERCLNTSMFTRQGAMSNSDCGKHRGRQTDC